MPREYVCWEDALAELTEFIEGRGNWWFFGGGMTTYPGRGESQDHKHHCLMELCRRGVVRRHSSSTDSIVNWEPTFQHTPDTRERSQVWDNLLVTRVN